MQTISLSISGSAASRSSVGGVPETATSAEWPSTRSSTSWRLPTSSVSSTSGCAVANARMSAGTNDSAAVVTAAIRRLRAAALGRLLRRLAALLQQADHVRCVGLERDARLGRPDAPPGALEQVAAELAPE